MKRTLLSLVVCFCMLSPLASGALVDEFSFLRDLPAFVQYVDVVRNEGDYRKAEELRTGLPGIGLEKEKQTVLDIRAATLLSRLYTEVEPKDLNRSEELLKEAEQLLTALEKNSFFGLILEAEIDSIHYLINPRNLGKGISSNSKINKAYKQHPDQVYARLMKASSLLYAPSIAGGDVNKALQIYLELLRDGVSILSRWDTASLYSNIGVVSMKRGEWSTAKGYLDAAKALYRFDPTLDAYLKEVQAKL